MTDAERLVQLFKEANTDDISDRGLMTLQVINKGAAPGLTVHGPAGSMNNLTLLMLGRIQLPKLFDAEAIGGSRSSRPVPAGTRR